ncbi:long-chain-fatty-acid--CoA ligase [Nonomuraea sp. B12E4]|uniref:long-chain-fatty-acid--CoA ligase n=1 Tax=Nonomuraea sp. B12E4 TaxID=3153564 RepID=UPI00325DB780
MYLTQGLHRALQQTPERPATIYKGRVRTYRESADRVARLAGALLALGMAEGDRCAMASLNSDRYHEYLLATWWLGGVVNPINVRWSPAEIAYSLNESETHVLLVDDALMGVVPELRDRCPGLTTVIYCGEGSVPPDGMLSYEDLIESARPVDDVRRGESALAGIFYTGGTTGFPKGVMLSHVGMLTSSMGTEMRSRLAAPGGRLLHAAPMFHLAALAAWTTTHVGGGTHVIVPSFEPVTVMNAVQEHRVNVLLLVPLMLQALVDHPQIESHDLSSITGISYGGSPISEALLARSMKAFPSAEFAQVYGMTELGPVAAVLTHAEHWPQARLRSAGRAAPHCEMRIVDADDQEVPRGTVGEIVARGENMMLGYWNKPGETGAALRGGWMHTGDGGYMDEDGYVFIVDRLKDMIISGGENVYSAEVENAIEQHPAVAACGVIGVPDDRWGERVHAVIMLRNGMSVTGEQIRDHVKSLIAAYKAPRSWEFVDMLPISGAGKVLKRALREKYWKEGHRQVG